MELKVVKVINSQNRKSLGEIKAGGNLVSPRNENRRGLGERNLNFWWNNIHKCNDWQTILFRGPVSLGQNAVYHKRPKGKNRRFGIYSICSQGICDGETCHWAVWASLAAK